MVRAFQRVIGDETVYQMKAAKAKLPDVCVACVGGGSNAIGQFAPFVDLHPSVRLIGVEAAGHGIHTLLHSATLSKGSTGVLHGAKTYLLQDEAGQIVEPHSISAGLDYPGVGAEHAHLFETKRAEYVAVTDDQALEAVQFVSQLEGILPALETAHALYYAVKVLAPTMSPGQDIVVCCSGRGDKDLGQIEQLLSLNK